VARAAGGRTGFNAPALISADASPREHRRRGFWELVGLYRLDLGGQVLQPSTVREMQDLTQGPQQLLDDRSGVQQLVLARDTYTYLHLPMVVGIVL
jgi:hypothetical protein